MITRHFFELVRSRTGAQCVRKYMRIIVVAQRTLEPSQGTIIDPGFCIHRPIREKRNNTRTATCCLGRLFKNVKCFSDPRFTVGAATGFEAPYVLLHFFLVFVSSLHQNIAHRFCVRAIGNNLYKIQKSHGV